MKHKGIKSREEITVFNNPKFQSDFKTGVCLPALGWVSTLGQDQVPGTRWTFLVSIQLTEVGIPLLQGRH